MRPIRAIVRCRPIQQPRSAIVPNPYAIELKGGQRAITEPGLHFLCETLTRTQCGDAGLRM